jgi:hypothetical protein
LHLAVSQETQRDLLNATFNMIKKRSGAGEQSFNIANVFYYNIQDWIDGTSERENWAYRCGLREETDHGEKGQFRKAWFAFQNQAEFPGTFP